MSEQATAERDAAFAAIGLTVELADNGLNLSWRGIETASNASYFVEIPFPGLATKIEVRWTDREHAEVRLDGKLYEVREVERDRSIRIPDDE